MNKLILLFFLFCISKQSSTFPFPETQSDSEIIELDPFNNPTADIASDKLSGMFCVNLDSYADKEEGIISLKVFSRDDIKQFNARYVTGITSIGDKKKNMPKDKSDFKFIESSKAEHSFLYFRRNDLQPNPWLLIYVEFNEAKQASVSVSMRERTFELYSSVQSNNFMLENNVPRLLKFIIERESDFGDSYLFHCSHSHYQTIVIGNLLNDPTNYNINPNSLFYQLYAHTIPATEQLHKQFTISVIVFGDPTSITVSVKNTFSSVYYFNNVRPKEVNFYFEVINAFDPFYLIGTYKELSEYVIYFEKLYGNFQLYYKDTIYGDSIDNVLPGLYDYNAPDYVFTTSNTDLFSGHCSSPCGFNIHFVSNHKEDIEMKAGEYRVVSVDKEKETLVKIAELGQVSVEIKNVGKNEFVYIIEDGQGVKLKDVEMKTYTGTAEKPIVLRFSTTSVKPTIVTIKLKSKNEYVQYKENEAITTNYAVYEIKEKDNTSEFEVTIQNNNEKVASSLNFYLGYGPMNFFFDPIRSKVPNFKQSVFTILNPYLQKYPYEALSNSKYYLLLMIESPEKPNFVINVNEKAFITLEPLKENTSTVVSKDSQYLLAKTEPEKELIIMTTKCSNEEVMVKLKYYHKTFKAFFIQKQFAINYFSNPFSQTSIDFNSKKSEEKFPGLMVYYTYQNKDDLDNIEFNNDFNLHFEIPTVEPNQADVALLKWRSPMLYRVDYNVSYEIYVYHDKSTDEKYDSCRTENYAKPTLFESDKMDLSYPLPINKAIDNYVFIVAQPTKNFMPKFFFRTIFIEQVHVPKQIIRVNLLWLYITIGVLGVVCIGLGIGYYFVLRKRNKHKIDMNNMPDNEALVNN